MDRAYGFLPASKTAPLTFQRPQKKSSKNSVMASVPTGPKGEKRPADVIGSAVKVMRIATGRRIRGLWSRDRQELSRAELGRMGGKKRAEGMTPEQRAEIANKEAKLG